MTLIQLHICWTVLTEHPFLAFWHSSLAYQKLPDQFLLISLCNKADTLCTHLKTMQYFTHTVQGMCKQCSIIIFLYNNDTVPQKFKIPIVNAASYIGWQWDAGLLSELRSMLRYFLQSVLYLKCLAEHEYVLSVWEVGRIFVKIYLSPKNSFLSEWKVSCLENDSVIVNVLLLGEES